MSVGTGSSTQSCGSAGDSIFAACSVLLYPGCVMQCDADNPVIITKGFKTPFNQKSFLLKLCLAWRTVLLACCIQGKMQGAEGGGREPGHGEGTQVPLAPSRLLVKSRAVGHVSTSTKHAKSLHVQIEAASRSVLSLNFFPPHTAILWWREVKTLSSLVLLVLPL